MLAFCVCCNFNLKVPKSLFHLTKPLIGFNLVANMVLSFKIKYAGVDHLYAIQLANPTLDNLERAIFAHFGGLNYKNARKICLRNVPLTNDSICRNIKEGGIYRLHFHQLHNCPTMCDVHLFEAPPSELYTTKSDCRIM